MCHRKLGVYAWLTGKWCIFGGISPRLDSCISDFRRCEGHRFKLLYCSAKSEANTQRASGLLPEGEGR